MLAPALAVVVLRRSPRAPLPPQVGDTSPFRRLALPTPSLVREGSGRPGPRYWQQRADYTIRATLDTASQSLRGDEAIRYGNNSPDTLLYVWLQLDQNLFADGSRGAALNPPGTRFASGGVRGGETHAHRQGGKRPRPGGRRAPPAATAEREGGRGDPPPPPPPRGGHSLQSA